MLAVAENSPAAAEGFLALGIGSSSVTVADVVTAYLRHSAAATLHCAESLAERQRTLNAFAATFGPLECDTLKPFHLQDWIDSHPAWKSISTRRAKANQIRAVFQWACDGERIGRNPFRMVRYAEAERRPDMPDATLASLCDLANKPFERALRWLRLTGCRLSELCRAQWSDVDLERGVWIIQRHKSRRFTCKPKVVALVPEAVALLRSIAKADGTIFLNTRNKPWTRRTLGQQLRRMKDRHKIDEAATLHGIRHAAASAAIGNGAPLKLVAEQLGHSTTAITERYYWHRSDAHLDAMRDAMQKGLQGDGKT